MIAVVMEQQTATENSTNINALGIAGEEQRRKPERVSRLMEVQMDLNGIQILTHQMFQNEPLL